ncbi:HAUS augmin-like complex subunit 5, partial [Struthio camelus]|uniref:HAUS augmin-like complex subunit 5 n=1 Tax=Struthio camelus TaxID=8801 RepID=UPI003604129D
SCWGPRGDLGGPWGAWDPPTILGCPHVTPLLFPPPPQVVLGALRRHLGLRHAARAPPPEREEDSGQPALVPALGGDGGVGGRGPPQGRAGCCRRPPAPRPGGAPGAAGGRPEPGPGPGEAGEEVPLGAALAAGLEPEVLVATRAACRIRAEALRALLEPRPRPGLDEELKEANERWLQAAQALLSRHPPGRVLAALEHLALESSRELQALNRPPGPPDPDAGSASEPEAPPSVETLIQEGWGAVGGLWARLGALGARHRGLRQRLAELRRELEGLLGGDPKSAAAARLALEAAGLAGGRAALARSCRELAAAAGAGGRRGSRARLRAARGRVLALRRRLAQRQEQLRALIRDAAALKGRLRSEQAQARAAAEAALAGAPQTLSQEGERLRRALGALGALGEPAPARRDPLALPQPLARVCDTLGFPPYKAPAALLPHVAELRQELRRLQRLLRTRQRAQEELRRRPAPDGQGLAAALRAQAEAEAASLLPRLQAVARQCQRRVDDWPRLQALVSQWWEQPAQWALAPPPGRPPLSHWLQRWSQAARGHAYP